MTTSGAPVGRLVVCPTPIGNMGDVTVRVLEELAAADVIACEDTRHTGTLLARHQISPRALVSLHEHNESSRARELRERVRAGAQVALVSDAGTPLVSDPGFELVRACLQDGLPVEVLPGPSAPVTALVASGMAATRWCFVGFLPRRAVELRELLASNSETLVAFESPRRLARTLALLAELDPARRAAVCRELTKVHEEVARGNAAELAERFGQDPARGEIVLVVAAAGHSPGLDHTHVRALRELVAAGAKPRAAASVLSKVTGSAANDLYRELMRSGE